MSEPMPGYVRLYYYTGKQWGMKVLWEKRLKIARYQDLNDPFELIPFNRTRKASRRFYDGKIKKLFNGNYGIICFSESWQTTLMWSHYGEKHTGMCLGFDVLGTTAEKVRYAETLLDDPYDSAHQIKGMSAKVFSDAMLCKYAGWRYEREQRVHARLEDMVDGIYYKNFDGSIQLREVILGPRCTLQPSEVVASVSNPPQDVDIYAARVAFGRFEVCKQDLVSTHTTKGWRERVKKLPDLFADQLAPDPEPANEERKSEDDDLLPW
jgi:hypothetical protein